MHGFKRKMFYVFQSNNLHSTTVRKVKKARDLDESDECRLTSSYIEPTTYTSLSNRCNAQEHNLLRFTGLLLPDWLHCRLLHQSRGSSSSVQLAAEATRARLVSEAPHPSSLRQQPCGSVFSRL